MDYVGVDACRSGWLCIGLGPEAACDFQLVHATPVLVQVIGAAKQVLIDTPIGLIDGGAEQRACDKAARRVLGAPRASAVF